MGMEYRSIPFANLYNQRTLAAKSYNKVHFHLACKTTWPFLTRVYLRVYYLEIYYIFSRSGLGVALRNLAFLEIDVHNNWRPFRPQISFVIDQVSDQSSLEVRVTHLSNNLR